MYSKEWRLSWQFDRHTEVTVKLAYKYKYNVKNRRTAYTDNTLIITLVGNFELNSLYCVNCKSFASLLLLLATLNLNTLMYIALPK